MGKIKCRTIILIHDVTETNSSCLMVHNKATTAAASVTTLIPNCKPKKVKDKSIQN